MYFMRILSDTDGHTFVAKIELCSVDMAIVLVINQTNYSKGQLNGNVTAASGPVASMPAVWVPLGSVSTTPDQ